MLKTNKKGCFQLSCGCQIGLFISHYCGIYHDEQHRPANEQRIIGDLKEREIQAMEIIMRPNKVKKEIT